jgi:hypothetical protein
VAVRLPSRLREEVRNVRDEDEIGQSYEVAWEQLSRLNGADPGSDEAMDAFKEVIVRAGIEGRLLEVTVGGEAVVLDGSPEGLRELADVLRARLERDEEE